MKKSIFVLTLVLFNLTIAFSNTFAETNNPKSQNEIRKLRDLFDKRDYAEGYKLGKQFTAKNPDDLELQYWYAANGSRSFEGKATLEDIEKLVKAKGENLWTLLALTTAQTPQKSAEALVTAEKLIKIAPDNEEAIFVYNSALFQNKKYAESVNFLNQNESKLKDKTRFLNAKAAAVYFVEKDKKEKGQIQSAFDIFAQAVKSDPLSVNANYLYGNYLNREKRIEESVPFLRKASELSPNVSGLRGAYWTAIKAQTKKTEEQKETELEFAYDSHLKQTENSPEALLAVWMEYANLTGWQNTAKPKHLQKKEQLEKLITQKYPNTKYDEDLAFIKTSWVYGKYFGKDEGAKSLEINNKPKSKRTADEVKFLEDYEAKNKLYKAEMNVVERAFLKRPQHFDKEKFGQISFNLFQREGKENPDEEETANWVKNAVENYTKYYGNLNSQIASVLLLRQESKPDSLIAKDAEKYARSGVAAAEEKVKQMPKTASPAEIKYAQLAPLNTLVSVLINEGKLDEAEKFLLQVSQLLEGADLQDFRLEFSKYDYEAGLAKFYTAKKDWDKAETFYIKIGSDNEYTKKNFEKLHEKRFGKKDGFDSYYAEIQKKLKIRAKERMAESRIKNAQDAVPFSLKDLDDKTVSFADLKGKVIVINVWGTWCGPCVAEMNELQELFDKYKDDKDVAILTIDSNDELAVVKKFVADRKLRIPVLIDDGYIFKTPQFGKTAAYPTTLFIDKNGKVAFVKTGNSGNLVEEFSWRVEILKEN